MKFSIQLSADYPDKDYGGDRVYGDMLAQATLADRLNFDSVTITEHHFMNCLMMPAPLQFAVKIAADDEKWLQAHGLLHECIVARTVMLSSVYFLVNRTSNEIQH